MGNCSYATSIIIKDKMPGSGKYPESLSESAALYMFCYLEGLTAGKELEQTLLKQHYFSNRWCRHLIVLVPE